jgi:hypothetical protein
MHALSAYINLEPEDEPLLSKHVATFLTSKLLINLLIYLCNNVIQFSSLHCLILLSTLFSDILNVFSFLIHIFNH